MKKDVYKEFESHRRNYFEKLKSEYLFSIRIARKKVNAYNLFEREKIRPNFESVQRRLGQNSRFLIEIRNAMDLDSRIQESSEFNRRFKDIIKKDKAETLSLLAQLEGLNLMYDYWRHHYAYIDAFENLHSEPVQILSHLEPELAKHFETLLEVKKRDFLRSLEMRKTEAEQTTYTEKLITSTRERIETDLLYKFWNAFNQHPEKIFEIVAYNLKNFDNASLVMFGDLEEAGRDATAAILKHCLSDNTEDNRKEFKGLIKALKEQGIESPALAATLANQSDNFEHRFLYLPFYFYYEKQFLYFLSEKLAELSSAEEIIESKKADFEKWEWLGTQKQLGELFLELERKGWIKDKSPKLIKNYFTGSNTIEQVLKPNQDARTKEKLYSGIYSLKYKPVFDIIKANKSTKE